MKALSLEDLSVENFDFLNSLKSLKELSINKIEVHNLSFLKNLKNLTKFVMHEKSEDENYISFITELKKLKEFQYPVSNMELYKCYLNLIYIGVDAKNIYNIPLLKDTKIDEVTIYNASSEEEADEVISKIEKYITLSSYGYVGI